MTDGKFEVLDMESVQKNKTWLRKMFGDISRQSVGKQIVIGGASGWCAGYMSVKVGKVAAATLGTTLVVLQIAQHQGYIKMNWTRLNSDTEHVRERLEQTASRAYVRFGEHMKRFVQENVFLAGGFAAGFFIGLAC